MGLKVGLLMRPSSDRSELRPSQTGTSIPGVSIDTLGFKSGKHQRWFPMAKTSPFPMGKRGAHKTRQARCRVVPDLLSHGFSECGDCVWALELTSWWGSRCFPQPPPPPQKQESQNQNINASSCFQSRKEQHENQCGPYKTLHLQGSKLPP